MDLLYRFDEVKGEKTASSIKKIPKFATGRGKDV